MSTILRGFKPPLGPGSWPTVKRVGREDRAPRGARLRVYNGVYASLIACIRCITVYMPPYGCTSGINPGICLSKGVPQGGVNPGICFSKGVPQGGIPGYVSLRCTSGWLTRVCLPMYLRVVLTGYASRVP